MSTGRALGVCLSSLPLGLVWSSLAIHHHTQAMRLALGTALTTPIPQRLPWVGASAMARLGHQARNFRGPNGCPGADGRRAWANALACTVGRVFRRTRASTARPRRGRVSPSALGRPCQHGQVVKSGDAGRKKVSRTISRIPTMLAAKPPHAPIRRACEKEPHSLLYSKPQSIAGCNRVMMP